MARYFEADQKFQHRKLLYLLRRTRRWEPLFVQLFRICRRRFRGRHGENEGRRNDPTMVEGDRSAPNSAEESQGRRALDDHARGLSYRLTQPTVKLSLH